jgi:hypothetical protein
MFVDYWSTSPPLCGHLFVMDLIIIGIVHELSYYCRHVLFKPCLLLHRPLYNIIGYCISYGLHAQASPSLTK